MANLKWKVFSYHQKEEHEGSHPDEDEGSHLRFCDARYHHREGLVSLPLAKFLLVVKCGRQPLLETSRNKLLHKESKFNGG